MADFQPFNLGQVLQTAEAIKAARSQSTTDRLREQYLGEQIQSARDTRDRQSKLDQMTFGKERAAQEYSRAGYILQSQNPKNLIESTFPELQQTIVNAGADWASVSDDQLKEAARQIQAKAGAEAGIQPGGLTEREKFDMETSRSKEQADAQQTFQRSQQEDQQRFTAGQNDLTRQADTARLDAQEAKNRERLTQGIRKEFRSLPTVKSYEAALPIIESAKNAPDTPAGDLQIVYSVGKALDPDSVVREGELQLTQNATPFLQRAIGKARAETKGKGRLTPQTRADLMNMLNQRMAGYEQAYQRDYDQYSKYATDQGVTAEQVVGTRPSSAFNQPASGGAADFIYVPGKGLQPARQ